MVFPCECRIAGQYQTPLDPVLQRQKLCSLSLTALIRSPEITLSLKSIYLPEGYCYCCYELCHWYFRESFPYIVERFVCSAHFLLTG